MGKILYPKKLYMPGIRIFIGVNCNYHPTLIVSLALMILIKFFFNFKFSKLIQYSGSKCFYGKIVLHVENFLLLPRQKSTLYF